MLFFDLEYIGHQMFGLLPKLQPLRMDRIMRKIIGILPALLLGGSTFADFTCIREMEKNGEKFVITAKFTRENSGYRLTRSEKSENWIKEKSQQYIYDDHCLISPSDERIFTCRISGFYDGRKPVTRLVSIKSVADVNDYSETAPVRDLEENFLELKFFEELYSLSFCQTR